jgi:hypothetical protein
VYGAKETNPPGAVVGLKFVSDATTQDNPAGSATVSFLKTRFHEFPSDDPKIRNMPGARHNPVFMATVNRVTLAAAGS